MKALMNQLRESAVKAILNADSPENLEALRVKYLGKKGELTAILKQMGKLSAEERPVMGQLANQIRAELESAIDETRKKLLRRALSLKRSMSPFPARISGSATSTRCTRRLTKLRRYSSAWALPCSTAPRSSLQHITLISSTPRKATPPATGRIRFILIKTAALCSARRQAPCRCAQWKQ